MAEDYYTTTGKKVGDFGKGFFLNIGIGIVASLLVSYLSIITSISIIGTIISILFFVMDVFLIIRFFKENRRYIAIGMLSSLIIPLLLFGACTLLLSGLS